MGGIHAHAHAHCGFGIGECGNTGYEGALCESERVLTLTVDGTAGHAVISRGERTAAECRSIPRAVEVRN